MVSTLWAMNQLRGVRGEGRADRRTKFEFTTVTDAIRQLGVQYGYTGQTLIVDDMQGEETLEEIVIPASMSDAEWIQDKARERGWVFAIDADGLRFHSPDRRSRPVDIEALRWFAGDPDVISFEVDGDLTLPARLVTNGVINERMAGSFQSLSTGTGNPQDDENGESNAPPAEVGVSSVPFVIERRRRAQPMHGEQALESTGVSERTRVRTERVLNKQLNRWTLKLKLVGNPNVRARRDLLLNNFGPMLDGKWWVRKAIHSYQANQVYITEIEAKRKGPTSPGDIQRGAFAGQNPDGSSVAGVVEADRATFEAARHRTVDMNRYRNNSVARERSQ
jgi:phage protein D